MEAFRSRAESETLSSLLKDFESEVHKIFGYEVA